VAVTEKFTAVINSNRGREMFIAKVLAAFVALTCFVSLCSASELLCSLEDAKKAERDASTLKNWDEIYKASKKIAHCDDGDIAEGYSESVTRLLANDWASVGKL
jgi:hypothetical protein